MSTQPSRASDGRARRRLSTMTRVQDVAISLFRKKGYEAVTVEDVARAADVGAASIFRNFGTKEALVLWDEYDPMLLAAVSRHLRAKQKPIEAVRLALEEGIAEVYDRERARILKRADLIARTAALAAAARLNVQALRDGLEQAFAPYVRDRMERALLAALLASTLEVSVEEWRRHRGRHRLDALISAAFELLERL